MAVGIVFVTITVVLAVINVVSVTELSWCSKYFYIYNVFRATRYKTTSLPAALNGVPNIKYLCILAFICVAFAIGTTVVAEYRIIDDGFCFCYCYLLVQYVLASYH